MDRVPAEAKTILFYYGTVLFVAVFWIIRRARRPGGMRLKLGGGSRPKAAPASPEKEELDGMQPPAEREGLRKERSLNVVFNWNGHQWDAYEVLGLPAGSSMSKVELTLNEALRAQNPQSHSFLRAAYEAIKNSSR